MMVWLPSSFPGKDIITYGGISLPPAKEIWQTNYSKDSRIHKTIVQFNPNLNKSKNIWIRYTNLISLALLFQNLLLNMFRMLVHPSSGACDLLWIYFMGIALVRCVLVLRCGSAGVVWYPYAGWSSASAWSTAEAPDDGCTNIRNMLSNK